MAQNMRFRARVMKYAWQIFKSTRAEWHLCMLKAWQIYRLRKGMREKPVTFFYVKADGTMRKAVGILRKPEPSLTPEGKRVTKTSYRTVLYFDLACRALRSFKAENLVFSECDGSRVLPVLD